MVNDPHWLVWTFCTRSITPRGRPATMPAKISRLMPLPMPRSVICSPSHMMKAVPVVSVSTVIMTKPMPGCSTMPPLVSMNAMPIDCRAARMIVI